MSCKSPVEVKKEGLYEQGRSSSRRGNPQRQMIRTCRCSWTLDRQLVILHGTEPGPLHVVAVLQPGLLVGPLAVGPGSIPGASETREGSIQKMAIKPQIP